MKEDSLSVVAKGGSRWNMKAPKKKKKNGRIELFASALTLLFNSIASLFLGGVGRLGWSRNDTTGCLSYCLFRLLALKSPRHPCGGQALNWIICCLITARLTLPLLYYQTSTDWQACEYGAFRSFTSVPTLTKMLPSRGFCLISLAASRSYLVSTAYYLTTVLIPKSLQKRQIHTLK